VQQEVISNNAAVGAGDWHKDFTLNEESINKDSQRPWLLFFWVAEDANAREISEWRA
jgi:hypothetical protein